LTGSTIALMWDGLTQLRGRALEAAGSA